MAEKLASLRKKGGGKLDISEIKFTSVMATSAGVNFTITKNVSDLSFVTLFWGRDTSSYYNWAIYEFNNGSYTLVDSYSNLDGNYLTIIGASGTTLTVKQQISGSAQIQVVVQYY